MLLIGNQRIIYMQPKLVTLRKVIVTFGLLLSLAFSAWLIISLPSAIFRQLQDGTAAQRVDQAATLPDLKAATVDILDSCKACFKNAEILIYCCIFFGTLTALVHIGLLFIFKFERCGSKNNKGDN